MATAPAPLPPPTLPPTVAGDYAVLVVYPAPAGPSFKVLVGRVYTAPTIIGPPPINGGLHFRERDLSLPAGPDGWKPANTVVNATTLHGAWAKFPDNTLGLGWPTL